MSAHTNTFQYILLGDMQVGKSAIMRQFIEGCFSRDYEATIGVDFGTRTLQVSDALTKLQVWDVLGSSSYRQVIRPFYRRAAGCLVVYSVANRESFNSVSSWLQDVLTFASPKAALVIVGNQTDRQREVSTEEGVRLANEHRVPAIEVSAQSHHQIELLFALLTKIAIDKHQRGEQCLESEVVKSYM